MPTDEKRLHAQLPRFLELLGEVSGYVGSIDLSKIDEVPAEALASLREGLVQALEFLHEVFAFRGEPPPSPEPGISFGALGPSLKRTLPQRLAAQLADELNAMPGSRLQDLSQFVALGLYSRITDLLRLVGFLEGERTATARRAAPATVVSTRHAKSPRSSAEAAPPLPASPPRRPAPATPPPAEEPPAPEPPRAAAPAGPGPDLSAYDIRIDEAGERVDVPGGSAWYASAPGPRATGEGLAAAFAVPFPGGLAIAVADGAESSLGARLASVVAARGFCRAAAAKPSAPQAAVRAAQQHLDMLLSALLSAGDASDGLTRVRGGVPPENARRILRHTRQPDDALRRVAPALATGFVGAVVLASSEGIRVSVVRLGPGSAELRSAGSVAPVFVLPRAGSPPFLAPGARGAEEVERIEWSPLVTLAPGDALLLGTPALSKGSTGAWAGLASLWPSFPDGLSTGDTARDLLRRAERWGETEPPHFGGALAFAVLLAR